MLGTRTPTILPDRSSLLVTMAAPGPVTRTSVTPRQVGVVKSTSFWRSGVMVIGEAMMSPRPSTSD
jgi:hypothetical protein